MKLGLIWLIFHIKRTLKEGWMRNMDFESKTRTNSLPRASRDQSIRQLGQIMCQTLSPYHCLTIVGQVEGHMVLPPHNRQRSMNISYTACCNEQNLGLRFVNFPTPLEEMWKLNNYCGGQVINLRYVSAGWGTFDRGSNCGIGNSVYFGNCDDDDPTGKINGVSN